MSARRKRWAVAMRGRHGHEHTDHGRPLPSMDGSPRPHEDRAKRDAPATVGPDRPHRPASDTDAP
ncbi:hypothetical protein PUR71_35975 [Streptomyces sp. SP17BM10]|uniref:hypothetical protein n=1 Tax=Streptomyces sp. SP17BM10 TaxID=3002530 RepID=UPI002E769BD4|nr:hypothetical protein [Streptomyces sp. SP17BM10]MEE1788256.1 hypothetical protein [Streptomyces sp. SP17BM10]